MSRGNCTLPAPRNTLPRTPVWKVQCSPPVEGSAGTTWLCGQLCNASRSTSLWSALREAVDDVEDADGRGGVRVDIGSVVIANLARRGCLRAPSRIATASLSRNQSFSNLELIEGGDITHPTLSRPATMSLRWHRQKLRLDSHTYRRLSSRMPPRQNPVPVSSFRTRSKFFLMSLPLIHHRPRLRGSPQMLPVHLFSSFSTTPVVALDMELVPSLGITARITMRLSARQRTTMPDTNRRCDWWLRPPRSSV